MKLCMTERHRGRFLQTTCSIIRKPADQNDDVESSTYTVGDCAEIRFKFTYSNCVETSISYRISQNTPKNSEIKTYITCSMEMNNVCSTKSFLCDNDWSCFIYIGNKKRSTYIDNVSLYVVEANFSVHFTETPPCNILYNDDCFTDFCLSPENGSGVQVHKVVMAAHSEVFRTMLNGEWKETAKDCLEVKGATEKTLQHLKEFMYLGSLPDGTDLQPLLLIAKCYMMKSLAEECAVKLARTVTAEEFPDLVKFAGENRLVELITAILQHSPDEAVNGINVLKKTEIKDK